MDFSKGIAKEVEQWDMKDLANEYYLPFSWSVCLDRALSYSEDGLKPIQRRILWTAYQEKLSPASKYMKSATFEGRVMNYSPHGGCLTSDTKMFLLNGEAKTIGELVKAGKDEWVLSIDENGEIVPALATDFRKTKDTNELYEITFANGFSIKATGNHKFKLINNDWVAAEDLHKGHILDYAKFSNVNDKYLNIYGNKTRSVNLHKLVDCYFNGSIAQGYNIHHIDENPKNNTPSNLKRLTRSQHMKIHNIGVSTRFGVENSSWVREEQHEKNSKLMTLYNKKQGLFKAKRILDMIAESNEEFTEQNYEKYRKTVTTRGANIKLSTIYANYDINSFSDLLYLYENDLIHINYETNKEVNKLGSNYTFVNKTDAHKAKCTEAFVSNGLVNSLKKTSVKHNFEFDYIKKLKCFQAADKIPFIVSVKKLKVETTPVYDFTVNSTENALISISEDNSLLACAHNSYGTVCSLADTSPSWQPRDLRVPFIDFKGSLGGLDSPAAAARYSELRLAPAAMEALKETTENAVDLVPNYNDELLEPKKLPARFPIAFINGVPSAMAVGFACNLPCHNPNEVMDACVAYVKDENISLKKLMSIIKGPDFNCGCDIIPFTEKDGVLVDGVKSYLETGSGSFIMKAKYNLSEHNGAYTINFYSLPYKCSPTKVIEDIKKSYEKGDFKELSSWKDLSDLKNPVNLELKTKKGINIDQLLANLFKKTSLQSIFAVNATLISNSTPKKMNVKEIIRDFINFRKECTTRKLTFRLDKHKSKLHMQEAIKAVLLDIDKAIKIIRNSADDKQAKTKLMSNFKIDEKQAEFILSMQLRKLTKADSHQINQEIKDLKEKIKEIEKILSNEEEFKNFIISELKETKKVISSERKCNIVNMEQVTAASEQSASQESYIAYKDNKIMRSEKKDNKQEWFKVSESGKLLAITEKDAQVCSIYDIPQDKFTVQSRFEIKGKVLTVAANEGYLVLVGKNGYMKTVNMEECDFSSRRKPYDRILKDKVGFAFVVKSLDELSVKVNDKKIIPLNEISSQSISAGGGRKFNKEIVSAEIVKE